MGNWIYVIVILVSAFIGYLTNLLAIKMLFHPYKEHKFFGKIHIPFTPGIIPKNRHRIAVSLGEMMEENILNEDVLKKELNESITKTDYVEKILNDSPIIDLLGEGGDDSILEASETIAKKLVGRFIEGDYATKIVDTLLKKFSSKLGFLGGMLGGLSKTFTDEINNFVENNGTIELGKIIQEELKKLSNSSLHDLMDNVHIKGNNVIQTLMTSVSDKALVEIISHLDFKKIITKQVDELDIKDFEKMILKVMRKELRAITILGGLLGGILGAVNIIFMVL